MEELKIFFSDLNEETQQRVLKFYGIADPKEGNFDSDIVPLFILECPEEGMGYGIQKQLLADGKTDDGRSLSENQR